MFDPEAKTAEGAELAEAVTRRDAAEKALAECEENIRRLMKAVGAMRQQCRSCPETIYVLKKANGIWAPYDKRGLIHFATCVGAEKHRRQRGSVVLTLLAFLLFAILCLVGACGCEQMPAGPLSEPTVVAADQQGYDWHHDIEAIRQRIAQLTLERDECRSALRRED